MCSTGRYLTEACDDAIARDIEQAINDVTAPAQALFRTCEEMMKNDKVEKERKKFETGGEDLIGSLTQLEESHKEEQISVSYGAVNQCLQDLVVSLV